MQAFSVTQTPNFQSHPYNAFMHPGGRPAKSKGSAIGQRIAEARRRADISQRKLAQHLGVTQQTIATLERRTSMPRSSTLVKIAEILGVSPNELLGVKATTNSHSLARGRMHQTFNAVSKLPRRQQTKILEVVDALLAKQSAG
jgi:transcriptional regulator with XRE-family HTH domain